MVDSSGTQSMNNPPPFPIDEEHSQLINRQFEISSEFDELNSIKLPPPRQQSSFTQSEIFEFHQTHETNPFEHEENIMLTSSLESCRRDRDEIVV